MRSKRNYRAEYAAESPKRKKERAKRNKARRQMIREGKASVGDGKHVDHKKPLRSGGSTARKNLRVRSASSNSSDNGHRKGEKQKRKK
jgi:5-methylcytosine-specific restriction endonuclease McrA